MFKLLLAEDETASREGILNGIHWEQLNIGSVETAKNGVLALQTAREFQPDILLTDIKMPRMDGMDLAKAVKEINPNCSILLISGYPEVEYLKSAIRLQVINFVEKPVELPALELKIRDAVTAQNEIREKTGLLKSELASLLHGPCFSVEKVRKILLQVFPQLNGAEVFCRSLLIRILSSSGSEAPEADLGDYQRKTEEQISPAAAVVGIQERFLQITQFGGNSLQDSAAEVLSKLQSSFPGRNIFISAGGLVPLEKQPDSLSTARAAIDLMFYDREQNLWDARSLAVLPEKQCVDFRLREFTALVSEGRQEDMRRFVRNLTQRIRQKKPSSRTVSNLFFQMFSALSAQEFDESSSAQTDSAEELAHEYVFLETMESKLLAEIDCYFKSVCQYNSRGVMEKVLDYVHKHSSEKGLSLNTLSRMFYLSEAYLCVRFKQITGKTFSRYLTEYRIEKSLCLLAQRDCKINDIAVRLGFDNGNYFSKIFKKEKGISPKEFRKRFGIL